MLGKNCNAGYANIRQAIELYLETEEALELPTAIEVAEVEGNCRWKPRR
ncbi:MAG: hypothetical protein L5656_04330 [Thermanaeromonas sp.]|nr:hypothetical protein [Thermanaeromonas sp.]